MRRTILIPLCMGSALMLGACADNGDQAVDRAFQDVNVIDETNLNDVMLTVADPNEAVLHFGRVTKQDPKRIDGQRGLASSLIRAKRNTEGVAAWKRVVEMPGRHERGQRRIRRRAGPDRRLVRGGNDARFRPADIRNLQTLQAGGDGCRQQGGVDQGGQLL